TKSKTMAMASADTGTPGRYHCLIADAERSAVRPHVGTQPHQYDTPVRLPSTGAYGRKASPHVAAMPPTRSGHIRINSVHPGRAAKLSSARGARRGMAAVPGRERAPWPTSNAPMKTGLCLLPPIARGVVAPHPGVLGWRAPIVGSNTATHLPKNNASTIG